MTTELVRTPFTAIAKRGVMPISASLVSLIVALWVTALCNTAFWRSALGAVGGLSLHTLPFLGSLFFAILLVIHLGVCLLNWPVIGRPLLAVVLVVSAATSWFESSYGVLIDKTMLRNVFETDTREVAELLNAGLLLQVLFLGVVPALLLFRISTRPRRLSKELAHKLVLAIVSLIAIALIVVAFSRDYAGFLRNNRELRHALTPTNLVGAAISNLKETRPRVLEVVGADAKRSAAALGRKPALLVLVVGETARTANFSLAGYARDTNPRLRAKNVLFYPRMFACGTSTATSLPCIFSALGREEFSAARASRQEGLLDVIQRAGIPVLWRDNNSGCKGACDRVELEDLSRLTTPGLCADGECRDEILLEGLQERLDRTSGDLVVVLHQKGNHGPAYFRRYPEEMAIFQPACRSAELGDCSREEVVNAYDNAILYTDHVLGRTIDLLAANTARFDTAMIYVSDHGESLGENGVYLHGLPYLIAPEEQTRVPLAIWLSDEIKRDAAIDDGCLEAARAAPITHDSIFHSVLGILDVETSLYDPDLDLFRPCRGPTNAPGGGR